MATLLFWRTFQTAVRFGFQSQLLMGSESESRSVNVNKPLESMVVVPVKGGDPQIRTYALIIHKPSRDQ